MVQNTQELGQLLSGSKISNSPYENVTGAVIVNTCGEAVPIPSAYGGSPYSDNSYARYCHFLGQKVNQYNWTWVSIVGYPLYYVSNTGLFPNTANSYGIYGMEDVGAGGFNAFLQGLDNQAYSYNSTWITRDLTETGTGVVYLSNSALDSSAYYGIHPAIYQTATRVLPAYIIDNYNLTVSTYVFSTTADGWNAGAVYRHNVTESGTWLFRGGFYALGLTRTPDIRVTALGLLSDFKPTIYASGYTVQGSSRLVVLQLGLAGGT
jgi:hypothetical protein